MEDCLEQKETKMNPGAKRSLGKPFETSMNQILGERMGLAWQEIWIGPQEAIWEGEGFKKPSQQTANVEGTGQDLSLL